MKVEGEIQITLPQTPEESENVTITFTSDQAAAFSTENPSYPVITNYTGDNYLKVTATTATYTIPTSMDGTTSLTLATAYPTDKSWGNVEITVDGPVSAFTVGDLAVTDTYDNIKADNPLLEHITALSFTGNNKTLTALKLGNYSDNLNYLPNLTTFSCTDHALTTIPFKSETVTSYNIGTVYLEKTLNGSAKSFQLKFAELFGNTNFKEEQISVNELTISDLRDEEGNAVTNVSAIKDEVGGGYWDFKTGDVYMDGTYKANIQVSADNKFYPNLILGDIILKVNPVDFKLTVEADEEQGKYSSSLNSNEGLHRNDEFVITPQPVDGFKFGHYESVGLDVIDSQASDPIGSSRFRVKGDVDPSLKLVFVSGEAKIEYFTNNYNGEISVYNGKEYTGSDKIASGEIVTVGSEITIEVKPNQEFSIEKVLVNNKDVFKADELNSDGSFRTTLTVPAEGLKVVAYFTSSEYTLTLDRETGVWTEFKIVDSENKQYCNNDKDEIEVAGGKQLTISIKLAYPNSTTLSSVLLNGKALNLVKIEQGSYIIQNVYMPKSDALLYARVKKLQPLKDAVTLVDDNLTYNGLTQEVEYTTTPSKLDGIEVTYTDASGLECNPINAGNYTAHFVREADDVYQKLEQDIAFTISPASLYITELPTVTKTDTGFEWTGGKVQYAQGGGFNSEPVKGKFSFNKYDDKCGTITFEPEQNNNYVSKNLKAVAFYGEAAKNLIPVKIESSNDDGAQLLVKNYDAVIQNGSSIVAGTSLYFEVLDADPITDASQSLNYKAFLVTEAGEPVIDDELLKKHGNESNLGTFDSYNLEKYIFRFSLEDTRFELALTSEVAPQENTYDGFVRSYNVERVYNLLNVKPNTDYTTDNAQWSVVYYDSNDRQVLEPINAGTYKVIVSRKASQTFKAFKAECKLIINKATISVTDAPLPTASAITKGSALANSTLTGSAKIEGSYQFDVNESVLNTPLTEDASFAVKFVPANGNYEELKYEGQSVTVHVTDRAVISYGSTQYGSISIRDDAGTYYWWGDPVISGTKLTVIPVANDGCELVSITKNGVTMSSPYSFVFGDEPVYIYAEFKVKEVEVEVPGDPVIDENSQYTITLPTSLVGAKLSKTGVYSVKRGGSFSFSVATLAADASKVVVKIGNVTIKPSSSGVYTLTDITSNYTVSVSLPNPTEIKLTVPTEYKNEGGYLMGRVQVQGPRSTGKFYYNDEVTLIAFPESGVKFAGWTGDVAGLTQVKEIVLTKDLTVKATFTGTPTGIEDIMAASITTGKGCVWVRGIANADVTIVSISGRVQAKERISGDTQINVPAGIYVVVLESGSDVKRTKVIVK